MPERNGKKPTQRMTLVRDINRAFGRPRIEATASRLRRLSARGDFLDITNALGFLESFTGGNLSAYRRSVGIPRHIQQALTLAFRTAIQHEPRPIPLRIAIVPARAEGIRLVMNDTMISIRLERSDRLGSRRIR